MKLPDSSEERDEPVDEVEEFVEVEHSLMLRSCRTRYMPVPICSSLRCK